MSHATFEQIVSVLAASDRRWMTASGITSQLPDGGVDKKRIEELLLAHSRDCEEKQRQPTVRYSSLPSRRTLEVLWGVVDKVGLRKLEHVTEGRHCR